MIRWTIWTILASRATNFLAAACQCQTELGHNVTVVPPQVPKGLLHRERGLVVVAKVPCQCVGAARSGGEHRPGQVQGQEAGAVHSQSTAWKLAVSLSLRMSWALPGLKGCMATWHGPRWAKRPSPSRTRSLLSWWPLTMS